MKSAACLFGGALVSAGLSAGPAQAADTAIHYSYGIVYGLPASGPYVYLTPAAEGPFGEQAFNQSGFNALVYATDLGVGLTHNRSSVNATWAYTVVASVAYFTPASTIDSEVSWDFGLWGVLNGAPEAQFVAISDLTTGQSAFLVDAGLGPVEGSATVRLTANHLYLFVAITGGDRGGGDSFGRIRFERGALIAQQPDSVLVEAQEGVTLRVAPAARAGVTYRWRKDGVELVNGGAIFGASGPELIIAPAQTKDMGVYDCVVTQGLSSEVSEPAVVAVRPCMPGDVDGNATVNFQDLNAVLGGFGFSCQ